MESADGVSAPKSRDRIADKQSRSFPLQVSVQVPRVSCMATKKSGCLNQRIVRTLIFKEASPSVNPIGAPTSVAPSFFYLANTLSQRSLH